MALPPEPIDQILPLAHAGVLAKVTKIIRQEKQSFIPQPSDPDMVDIPRELPLQIVQLQIQETLFGDLGNVGTTIEVLKPAGEYVLREGVEGPFLLQRFVEHSSPQILGMYGPDSYSLKVIRAAMTKHGLAS